MEASNNQSQQPGSRYRCKY